MWTNQDKQSCRLMERFQSGRSEPGDIYFLEFWQGVGPGGRILDPIMVTVGYLGERLYCSLGRRLSLN